VNKFSNHQIKIKDKSSALSLSKCKKTKVNKISNFKSAHFQIFKSSANQHISTSAHQEK